MAFEYEVEICAPQVWLHPDPAATGDRAKKQGRINGRGVSPCKVYHWEPEPSAGELFTERLLGPFDVGEVALPI